MRKAPVQLWQRLQPAHKPTGESSPRGAPNSEQVPRQPKRRCEPEKYIPF